MHDETLETNGASAPLTTGSDLLAQWLWRLMREPRTASSTPEPSGGGSALASQLNAERHREFLQQLPDFVMALLLQDESATGRYSALLYHLVGCDSCHRTYLETYDALRAALSLKPDESIACLEDGKLPGV